MDPRRGRLPEDDGQDAIGTICVPEGRCRRISDHSQEPGREGSPPTEAGPRSYSVGTGRWNGGGRRSVPRSESTPSKTVTESDLAAIGLLKVKPALAQAPATDQDRAGSAARNRLLRQFTKPWNDGGWIAWSVLALGLAIFGVMAGVILIPLGKSTALVIEITDSGCQGGVRGQRERTRDHHGPERRKVYVEPGAQELTISYGGLRTKTKRIELNKGDKKTITVSIVNKEIVASLDHEFSLIPDSAKGHGPRGEATAKGTAKAQVKGEGPRQEPLDQPLPNVATMPPKVFGRPFLVRGEWTIENDEIVQPTLASGDEMSSTPRLRGADLVELRSDPGGEKDRRTPSHWGFSSTGWDPAITASFARRERGRSILRLHL